MSVADSRPTDSPGIHYQWSQELVKSILPNTSGIYQIKCTANGKTYIGSAVNLRSRRKSHYVTLRNNTHRNAYLQNSFNKYGEELFEFSILEHCAIEILIEREQYYIDSLSPEFNICRIAGSALGTKRTEEHKRMMSLRFKGRTFTEEALRNIRAAQVGKPRTAEQRSKQSLIMKGKPQPSHRKRVQQLDRKTGALLATYVSVRIAMVATGALHVSEVCLGYHKSSGGYGWRYASQEFDELWELLSEGW